MGYLGIADESTTEITTENLLQKLQEAADAKSTDTMEEDKREISISGIPSSGLDDEDEYAEYRKAIERCGIENKNEIQGIIDLHDQGYFVSWLEGASVEFDIVGGSGAFVTGSNGTHAHIRSLMAHDDTEFTGGDYVSPIDGSWRSFVSCEFGTGYVGHTGMDLAVPQSTPVYAIADGRVLYVSKMSGKYKGGYNAYGIHVVINHGGKVATLYAHNSQAVVSAGQTISAGQVIALSGDTGNSSGPHLHLEVIENGVPRNARAYLP